AKKYVLDAIYCNAVLKQLEIRQHHAAEFLANQKKMLDGGECNIIDYNNAVLAKVKLDADIQQMQVERDGVMAQLARLNGGNAISITADEFEPVMLPPNFDEWFASAEHKNPALGYVKSEVELSKKQLTLNKALNLPSISVGYMSEHTPGEHLRGISLGVSIPLWSNRNKVKQAKAAISAAEAKKADAAHQFYGQLKALYTQVAGLQKTALAYRQTLLDAHNCELLEKALQSGTITQLEYIAQHSFYYESIDKALEAERDYQKAYADLTAYDL
ncbi:MAG: TolC family protein, partial [Sodaliphilus sp.]